MLILSHFSYLKYPMKMRPNYFILWDILRRGGAWRGIQATPLNPLWISHWEHILVRQLYYSEACVHVCVRECMYNVSSNQWVTYQINSNRNRDTPRESFLSASPLKPTCPCWNIEQLKLYAMPSANSKGNDQTRSLFYAFVARILHKDIKMFSITQLIEL